MPTITVDLFCPPSASLAALIAGDLVKLAEDHLQATPSRTGVHVRLAAGGDQWFLGGKELDRSTDPTFFVTVTVAKALLSEFSVVSFIASARWALIQRLEGTFPGTTVSVWQSHVVVNEMAGDRPIPDVPDERFEVACTNDGAYMVDRATGQAWWTGTAGNPAFLDPKIP